MNRKKKVYISGPISGHIDTWEGKRDVAFRFRKHERALKKEGYEVVNPTRFLLFRWGWLYRLVGYRLTLLYDLWRLSRCDAIYQLPGGYHSRGCNIEWEWAEQMNMEKI